MMPRSTGVPVAYLRRSRVQSDKPGTVSHEAQLAAVHKLVDDDPRLVILEDWGVSGQGRSVSKRTGYAELRRMIAAGEASIVVSYSMSRLARSVSELSSLIDLCNANGVPVRTVDREVDTTSATGRLITHVLAAVDQFTAEVAAEHSAAGVALARAAGKHIGRTAYGADPKKPEENPAAVVAAFQEAGSLNGAARTLNDRGVPTKIAGGRWTARTIKAVVNRGAPGTLPTGGRRGARTVAQRSLSGLLHCGGTLAGGETCGHILTSKPRPGRTRLDGTPRTAETQWYCPDANKITAHSRPQGISEARLLPYLMAEAAHLRPLDPKTGRPLDETGLDLPTEDTNAKRAILKAERTKLLYQHQKHYITDDELDASMAPVLDQLATLDAHEAGAVFYPQPIDWTTPDAAGLNATLRALWRSVQLGPDLLPLPYPAGFDWTVPEWRAD